MRYDKILDKWATEKVGGFCGSNLWKSIMVWGGSFSLNLCGSRQGMVVGFSPGMAVVVVMFC